VGGRNAVERFSRDRLRAARASAGVTQYALDEGADLPRGTVAQYESALREPTVQALTKLATALGVDPEELRDPGDEDGPTLGDLRVRTGWTQAQFAQRAGLTRGTFAAIERGEHAGPTPGQLTQIAAVLRTTSGDVQAAYDRARAAYLEHRDGGY
jgi:transcriptional regulator with XRE-family HTH domain